MSFRGPFGAVVTLASTFFVVAACSSSNDKPNAAAQPEGGITPDFDGGQFEAGLPEYCTSKVKDKDETDIDCGGLFCSPCALGKACAANTDCQTGQCKNSFCANCTNNVTDGSETDVDCGGASCAACTVGKHCNQGTDCKSGTCTGGACACPPHMAIVSLAGGGAYCVDATEVTKGEYNKFITANVPVTDQVDICKPPTNTTFVPNDAWPPATVPGPIEFNFGIPVHYVDWCDAAAYCKWAKKELCGKIGGGAADDANPNDSTKDAWYNACSAQGAKDYPYGLTFADLCNGGGGPGGVGNGSPADTDPTHTNKTFGYPDAPNNDANIWRVNGTDGNGNLGADTNAGCQGGSTSLYQMSGNVAEWVDSCDGTTSTANCRVRGGSYASANNATALACKADRHVARVPSNKALLADIGFRCCVY